MTKKRMTYRPIPSFYDAEYNYLDLVHKDIPFFLKKFGRKPRSILEIGVGTGRAAIAFAEAGHCVVGLDYSPDVLRIARNKRAQARQTPQQFGLRLADAKAFSLSRRFDFVCVLFNTFLMLLESEDQISCLKSIRRHLRPTGRLLLDIFNPNFHMLAERETKDIGPATFNVDGFGTVSRMTDVVRDALSQTQTFTLRYQWKARGKQRFAGNRFTLTWFTRRELQLLLQHNGLLIEHIYGDYDGSELSTDSPRMIVCCRRQ